MPSFSTNAARAPDAIPYWQDFICKSYVSVDCAIAPETRFKAQISLKKIGRTELSSVSSEPVGYARTKRHIQADNNGSYLLTLLTKGRTVIEQADQSCQLGTGDFCLLDTARPYRFDYPKPYQAIHLKIPRDELHRRLPLAETISGARVPAQGRYAQLAAVMLRSSVELLDGEDTTPMQLEPAFIDLIALAFDEAFQNKSDGNMRYRQIVEQAREIIAARLFDPELDLSQIPREIGVSNRSLYRAFAQFGDTPARFLAEKRLNAARDLIFSGHVTSVSEVAMACGFNDFSHFSRTFKLRFGEAPKMMIERLRKA